jgi:hypothetical protein
MHVVRCKCEREQAVAEDPDPAAIGVLVVGEVVDDTARDFLLGAGWRRTVSGRWACPFCVCRYCEGRGGTPAELAAGAGCLGCGGSGRVPSWARL